jgi:hypothetical protein
MASLPKVAQRRFAFGRSGGMRHRAGDGEAVAVLHQRVAHVAEHALAQVAIAIKPRVGIGGTGVGLVRALLAAKVALAVAPARRRRAAAVLVPVERRAVRLRGFGID